MNKSSSKFINLIFSLKEKDEAFQNAINSISSHFYTIKDFSFLFPVEANCLGEILSSLDLYFQENYGLETLANHIYCGDCEKIFVNDKEFSLKSVESVLELLKECKK